MELPKNLRGHYLIHYIDPVGTTHILDPATAAAYHPALFNRLFEEMEQARRSSRADSEAKLLAILEGGCPKSDNSLTVDQQNEVTQ